MEVEIKDEKLAQDKSEPVEEKPAKVEKPVEAKKEQPKKEEPKKEQPKKAEPKKEEPKKEEEKKPEPVKEEPKKEEPKKEAEAPKIDAPRIVSGTYNIHKVPDLNSPAKKFDGNIVITTEFTEMYQIEYMRPGFGLVSGFIAKGDVK